MRTTVTLTHRSGLHCETTHPDQSLMAIDPGMATAADRGHSPLELLALAHGACTVMMLVKAGKEIGLDLSELPVDVTHEYRPGPPMLLESAHLRFHLPTQPTESQRSALLKGAALCPVHSALRHDITVTFELITPDKENS